MPEPVATATSDRIGTLSKLLPLTSSDLERLYRLHSRAVLAYFARRVLDPETAVDLLAETFAAAYEARAGCRGGADEERMAWVWGIARHRLSGFLRRGAIERRAIERLGVERRELRDGEFDRVLDLAGSARVRAQVAEHVQELPDDQREALRLRIIEERDYPEVAAQLGVSEPTARARVSRGLRALAARLAAAREEVDAP